LNQRARWRAHKGVHLSEVVKRMSTTITTTATTSIAAIVSLFDVVSFSGLTSGEYMLPDRIVGVY
jgi:hypothetical protein